LQRFATEAAALEWAVDQISGAHAYATPGRRR